MRYLCLKYQSPNPYSLEIGQNVSQGHKVKHRVIKDYIARLYRFLSETRLKFLKSRSKSKVKVTRSKVMVSNERSRHKVSTCEISKPYPL